MKLKKAVREYARAVDELALVTERIRLASGLAKNGPKLLMPTLQADLLEWRDEARREKKRTVSQMNAVMAAMQYRGKNYYDPNYLSRINLNTVTSIKDHVSLFFYMCRLKNGVSDWETKRKLAKQACESYLKLGNMAKSPYEIEDMYYNVFGERVRLLEH